MQTFILITLLTLAASLMVVGFKNEDNTQGNKQHGKRLTAAGFGILALAGFVVYGFGGQGYLASLFVLF